MTESIRGVLLGMACGALFAAPALAVDSAGARAGTAVSQGAPEVVIYNDNRALVRQPVELPAGSSRVEMGGLPARIDSTSIRLDGVRVLRQAYHYDVWDADLVFRRCLGDSIFYRYGGRRYRGVLAGIDGNELFILRADSTDVLTIMNRQQLSEIELPRARRLRTTPTLTWELESGKARTANLSYVTAGLGWTAEYAAVLDKDERGLELSGWAVIANRSGTAFQNAKVTLVAGEVNSGDLLPDRGLAEEGAPAATPSAAPELFAYRSYPLDRALSLDDLETAQVPIVSPARIAARRAYRFDGARDGSKVRVELEFTNDKTSGLGAPLPEGRVRIYAASGGGQALAGEDRIQHTAAGEKVRLLSGVAFDLVGERERVRHTRVSRNVTEDAYRIVLRNHGARAAKVTVEETLYGNWDITQKSAEFRRPDADTAEFDVDVPSGGQAEVTYTVRYTF
ncbi:MAG TPA: DUF4139 domain-containing protein [Candidatus Eisenbacteria bacterium]|nr:DUF4139 domain-containing protein [Candidatus Eisenbacteria bacterium]